MYTYKITEVTAASMSKTFSLTEGGAVTKNAGKQLYRGNYCVREFKTHESFLEYLNTARPGTSNVYGLPKADFKRKGIIASRAVASIGELTRTRKDFEYATCPGILVLDVDPDEDHGPNTSFEYILSQLNKVIPDFSTTVPFITAHSTSSFIYNGEEPVFEERGKRIYVFVHDASAIMTRGDILFNRLNLAGNLFYTVSASGSKLERGLIDKSVFKPEHLDYCGGAVCRAPLNQRRPPAVLHNAGLPPLDLTAVMPDLTPGELKQLQDLRQSAMQAIDAESREVHAAWAEARLSEKELKVGHRLTDMERASFLKSLRHCHENRILNGEFLLPLMTPGEFVSVSEVLEDKDIWEGREIPDPLEPEYHNRSAVAKLYVKGACPTIHSFAHGGHTYKLTQSRELMQFNSGDVSGAVDRCITRLRNEMYRRSVEVVEMRDGGICPLTQVGVESKLDSLVTFYKTLKSGADQVISCPSAVSRRIADARDASRLQSLKGVVRYPVMRLDGTVFDDPGYDPVTQLYLEAGNKNEFTPVPANPTDEEVRLAYDLLMSPYRFFPFCSDTDRGVLLASLLTVPVRPVLPTAPAFLYTAPMYGSGKSLLASCVATLTGDTPSPRVWNERAEEREKAMIAALRTGSHTLIYDNLRCDIKCTAFAMMLTTDRLSGRLLGASDDVTLPTNVMFLFTGNNILPQEDMARRMLTCSIDPRMERPDKRKFDFHPLNLVRSKVAEMRHAALVLLRAGMRHADSQGCEDTLGSFEEWVRIVNHTVVWLSSEGYPVSNPLDAVEVTYSQDPETLKLTSLLSVWYRLYRENPVVISDLMNPNYVIGIDKSLTDEEEDQQQVLYQELQSVIIDILGDRNRGNQRMMNNWLKKRVGRPLCGLTVQPHPKKKHNRLQWCIKVVDHKRATAILEETDED